MWECFDDPAPVACILTAQLTEAEIEKKKKNKKHGSHLNLRLRRKFSTFQTKQTNTTI